MTDVLNVSRWLAGATPMAFAGLVFDFTRHDDGSLDFFARDAQGRLVGTLRMTPGQRTAAVAPPRLTPVQPENSDRRTRAEMVIFGLFKLAYDVSADRRITRWCLDCAQETAQSLQDSGIPVTLTDTDTYAVRLADLRSHGLAATRAVLRSFVPSPLEAEPALPALA